MISECSGRWFGTRTEAVCSGTPSISSCTGHGQLRHSDPAVGHRREIRQAEYVAEYPFLPKAAGRKVCCPCYLDAMTAISLMCDCACATVCVQRKLTSKEETNEEDVLSSRPAWVIDHNLCHLWSEWGLDEEGIFRRTSASRRTRWRRSLACRCGLRRGQVAELEQAGEQQQPHPPQPQPRRVRLR